MYQCRVSWLLPLLAIGIVGCTSTPLPAVKEVAQIRITVARMPDEVAHRNIPALGVLKEKADIDEMIDWLNAIDWSQSSTDMAVIKMPSPDGDITIDTRAGTSQSYGFYWDGKFTLAKANRLIQSRDIAKLKQIVQRVCK